MAFSIQALKLVFDQREIFEMRLIESGKTEGSIASDDKFMNRIMIILP